MNLVQRGGLGEEVGTDGDPRSGGARQVLLDVFVLHQSALGAPAPVAQPEHGKIHAGGLHLVPVDVVLEGGYVHAHIALLLQAIEVVLLVVLKIVLVKGVGLGRDGGFLGDFGFLLRHNGIILKQGFLLQTDAVEESVRVFLVLPGLLQGGKQKGCRQDQQKNHQADRRGGA